MKIAFSNTKKIVDELTKFNAIPVTIFIEGKRNFDRCRDDLDDALGGVKIRRSYEKRKHIYECVKNNVRVEITDNYF
jgi:hypothetical protein